MKFIEFPIKHPEINLYINQLKGKYHKIGIDGFYGHNLLVVGGNNTERSWSTLYTPFVLRNFLLEHIEKYADVYKKRIICTNKSVKQIESEIFQTPIRQTLKNSAKQTGGFGLFPKHIIELLSLFDIHKGMKSLLNKLSEELASDYSLPLNRYRLGLIIATLKSGENISDLPKPFVDLCVRHDLSKRVITTSKDSDKEVEQGKENATSAQDSSKDKYIFREEDENYLVRYENEEFKLKTTDGLKYMQHLLKNPHPNEFTPKQLYQVVKDSSKLSDKYEHEALIKGDLSKETYGEYADIVDRETKEKIKELEYNIEIAEATGNEAKVEELRSQLDDFKQEYVRKYLRKGKSIKFPSSMHKKPYDSINNAINRAVKKIKEHSNKKEYKLMLTYKHLDRSIEFKDSHFYYNPENLPNWQY